MQLKELQEKVDSWAQKHKNPYWQPLEQFARLAEETGELARELNHRFGPKQKKPTEEPKELEEEIGDIIFTLACLANSLNIDLDDCVARALIKCETRDSERYKKSSEE